MWVFRAPTALALCALAIAGAARGAPGVQIAVAGGTPGLPIASAGGASKDPGAPIVIAGAARGAPGVPLAVAAPRSVALGPDVALVVSGATDDRQLGNELAAADLDGDRVADLVIGAQWSGGAGRNIVGRAYVLAGGTALGGRGRLDLSAARPTARIDGGGRESRLGSALAVGHVTGARGADLVLGALLDDPFGQDDAGAVYAIDGARAAGRIDLADVQADVLLAGRGDARDVDQLGSDVALGDFNADGRLDIAAAATARDGDRGAVLVWWGPFAAGTRRNLNDEPADWSILGDVPGAWLGSALAAGDVDADGVDDLLVSAASSRHGDERGGVVHVLAGGAGVGGTVDLAITNATTTVVGPAGSLAGVARGITCGCRGRPLLVDDLDLDGAADLAIGSPLDGGAGALSILPGPLPPGIVRLAAAPTRLVGADPGGRLGWSVATGGLGDGGSPVLVIAAPWSDTVAGDESGSIHLVPLPIAAGHREVGASAALEVLGPATGAGDAGAALAVADLDGDGRDDLAVGLADAAPARRTGAVYVLRGPLLEAGHPTATGPTASATATGPTASATATGPTATATATGPTASATATGTTAGATATGPTASAAATGPTAATEAPTTVPTASPTAEPSATASAGSTGAAPTAAATPVAPNGRRVWLPWARRLRGSGVTSYPGGSAPLRVGQLGGRSGRLQGR